MKKLKLKFVKITFKDSMIKTFGHDDIDHYDIDHIETKMSCCNGKNFVLEIYYQPLNNEVTHVETIIFKSDEILSIEQRWL